MDQGAYTCEAINVKGRVLATPDCIVRIVNIPAPPPPPPQQPRSQLACNPQGAYSPYTDTRGQCACKVIKYKFLKNIFLASSNWSNL